MVSKKPLDTERCCLGLSPADCAMVPSRHCDGLQPVNPDLTNPGNIPFGRLPRATQEAMVTAHVLDGVALEFFDGDTWVWDEDVLWHPLIIYRVVQP